MMACGRLVGHGTLCLMERHEWRERDEEGVCYFKAEHHAGRWTFATLRKGDDDWTPVEVPEESLWRTLRDLLWRKYQRKRCPWRLVEGVDKHLEELAKGNER